MTARNTGAVQAVPQLSYLELITFIVGNRRIGDYWQRFSGGQIQVSTARSAPPNMRTTRPMAGKYTVSGITLEREYTPNDSHVNTLFAIMQHLKDPGNNANDIKIVRELNNSPTGSAATKTKITYIGCVPTSIPILEDGDTTADANIMPTRLSFEVSDVAINIGGNEVDILSMIGTGFSGTGGGGTKGLGGIRINNTRTGGSTATPL